MTTLSLKTVYVYYVIKLKILKALIGFKFYASNKKITVTHMQVNLNVIKSQ